MVAVAAPAHVADHHVAREWRRRDARRAPRARRARRAMTPRWTTSNARPNAPRARPMTYVVEISLVIFARVFSLALSLARARSMIGSDARDARAMARSRARTRDAIETLTVHMFHARLAQVSALLASPFLLFASALSPITPRAHRALDDAMLALADDDDDGGDGRAPRMCDGDAHTPDGRRRTRGGRQGAHAAPAMGCFNSPSRRASRCVRV